uniref:Uncharacterized protein n=1 Tax=Mycetohabitans sp. TaxID=2571162 RepID=A0A6B9HDQ6_9BURK|nr:hypothetical protein [Mycetohabitans sp.]
MRIQRRRRHDYADLTRLTRAGRCDGDRRRRAVRDARRHRSAHAHGIAVHGHSGERRLLYRH